MTTFTPTHDVVAEATAAGFFPPRHNVEITQVTELTDRVMRLTFRDPFIASHAKPAQFVNLFTHDDFMLMPRPFGVSEVDGDEVSVIFAVVGHGTEQLAGLQAGGSPPLRAACRVARSSGLRMADVPRRPICLASSLSSGSFISSRFWLFATGCPFHTEQAHAYPGVKSDYCGRTAHECSLRL